VSCMKVQADASFPDSLSAKDIGVLFAQFGDL
jgi:hypothetical protein